MSTINLRETLTPENIREKAPGMSEPVYAFAEYIGKHVSADLEPEGLPVFVICALDDIKKQRCGFAGDTTFPDYLKEHKFEIEMQAPYFLQIIDAVTDQDYADEVRKIFATHVGWNPPKRLNPETIPETTNSESPANIRAAVNWWRKTLVDPKMDNGEDAMTMFMALFGTSLTGRNTEAAITAFCDALETVLCEEVCSKDNYSIDLRVDYGPEGLLYEALERANGAADKLQFPCKTNMSIEPRKVAVSYGYCKPYETIWEEA